MFSIDRTLCINCGSCVTACPMSVFQRDEDGVIAPAQKECLDCFHCTAACPVRAISHHALSHDACYPAPPEPAALANRIMRRRSIRHFKPETPDRALIEQALNGAAYAPSAKNQQVCRWTVVLGAEQVDALYQTALEWAKGEPEYRHLVWLHRHGHNPVTCGAPCLVIVHTPVDGHNPQIDAIIAMTLAEQLLVDTGLGTCWGGYMCRMINGSPALQQALDLPAGHQVHAVLMAGHAEERYPNIPCRPDASIHWVE